MGNERRSRDERADREDWRETMSGWKKKKKTAEMVERRPARALQPGPVSAEFRSSTFLKSFFI